MRTKQHSELINDEQSLVSAQFQSGTPIQTHDDGFGPLYILRDSMGILGIIRAQSWEDAYEIAEDEMFPDADMSWEEMQKEYATEYKSGRELWMHENGNNWEAWKALSDAEKEAAYRNGKDVPFTGDIAEHPCWQEAYGFRPNGARDHKIPMSHIYSKDLNGESLDLLTPAMVADLGIVLNIENNE